MGKWLEQELAVVVEVALVVVPADSTLVHMMADMQALEVAGR